MGNQDTAGPKYTIVCLTKQQILIGKLRETNRNRDAFLSYRFQTWHVDTVIVTCNIESVATL